MNFFEMADKIRLNLAIENSPESRETKKRMILLHDTFQKKFTELNDDNLKIYQYLLSEKSRIEKEKIGAAIKKPQQEKRILEKLLSNVVTPYLDHYKKQIGKLENAPKENLSEDNVNHIVSETDTASEEVELQDEGSKEEHPGTIIQISCDASKEKILEYFMILSKEKNPTKHEPFMKEEDIKEMVENNFEIFERQTPTPKYYPINLTKKQKGILTYFVYQFYQKYGVNGPKIDYASFLITNIKLFKPNTPEKLVTNMSYSKRPVQHHIIPIEKYLK